MRIVVVGAIVADTIEHLDGGVTHSLGGIAHSIAALAALSDGRHEIVPICRVGADCRDRVAAWARDLEGVSLEATVPAEGPHPTVRLSYAEGDRPGERVERLLNAPRPLDVDDLAAAEGADVVLLNYITGRDVTAPAMRHLRAAAPRLYVDVHSLALATAEDGRRFYRRRDDWGVWLRNADVVQCNLAEAATICSLAAHEAKEADVRRALVRLLERGFSAADASPEAAGEASARRAETVAPRQERSRTGAAPPVWLLTLGGSGALLIERRRSSLSLTRIAAPTVEAVDPTGAGDAFGAGYVCAWLDGCGPRQAAARAVLTGSAAATRAGAPDPQALRHALREASGALGTV